MARDGSKTRQRILDAALDLVLAYGYSGTSLDRVIERSGTTKGTFFYHFDSKADLGHALLQEFADNDERSLRETLADAEARSDDPLEQVMTFVELFEKKMSGLDGPHPGCLFASYITESELFGSETLDLARNAMELWKTVLGAKFAEVIEAHPPAVDVDPQSLADAITVVFEGSFILSKTYRDPDAIAEHLAHYRRYLELLFR